MAVASGERLSAQDGTHSGATARAVCLAAILVLGGACGCASVGRLAGKGSDSKSADSQQTQLIRRVDTKTQAEACRRTAEELSAHEKDDAAIAQYERARQLHPKIRGVAHPLAVLYDRQGRVDAAEREYLRALKETPKSAEVLSDYGYFLYSRERLEEAEQQLRQALARNGSHEKALLNLGLVLAARGQFDEAYPVFEKAVGPAAAHHNVGLLMAKAGRTAEGERHLQQAIARDPSLKLSATALLALSTKDDVDSGIELTGYETPAGP